MFPGDIEPPLQRRSAVLQQSVAEREGTAQNLAQDTIRWLEAQIKTLMERDSADKAQQKRITDIQMRIAAIGIDIERIQAEITQIEGPEKARMTAAHAERANAYFSYFKNLKSEQQTLEELYAPMKARVAERGASQERDLEFVIRWEADLDQWLARGSVLFDQRRTIPYGTMQDLQKAAGRSRTAI